MLTSLLIAALAVTAALPSTAQAPTPAPSPRPLVVAYAGDSTTAQGNSWITHIHAPDFSIRPGYARSGYRTDQVLAQVPAATGADVLVIMLGINDIHYAATDDWAAIIARVNLIADKVNAKHVILCATAPSNITRYVQVGSGKIVNPQAQQNSLNALIKANATERGYSYVDPFSAIRSAKTGGYHAAAYTADGTHPSTAGYVLEAQKMATEIQAVTK